MQILAPIQNTEIQAMQATLAALGVPVSYTPSWSASGGGAITGGTYKGSYVKIGKLVYVQIEVYKNNPASGHGGPMSISLPLPVSSAVFSSTAINLRIYGYPVSSGIVWASLAGDYATPLSGSAGGASGGPIMVSGLTGDTTISIDGWYLTT